MPITPMFHVHAWGVPYGATLVGIKQVYPGSYEPNSLVGPYPKTSVGKINKKLVRENELAQGR